MLLFVLTKRESNSLIVISNMFCSFICLGQFCNGLAGSVTQVIPTTLSKTWFPSNERTTATAIAVVANAAGAVMAFTLGA